MKEIERLIIINGVYKIIVTRGDSFKAVELAIAEFYKHLKSLMEEYEKADQDMKNMYDLEYIRQGIEDIQVIDITTTDNKKVV
ncbi:hypothetical protein ACMA5I_10245 [Paracoccaceae bacterium GXU_MW_L88]